MPKRACVSPLRAEDTRPGHMLRPCAGRGATVAAVMEEGPPHADMNYNVFPKVQLCWAVKGASAHCTALECTVYYDEDGPSYGRSNVRPACRHTLPHSPSPSCRLFGQWAVDDFSTTPTTTSTDRDGGPLPFRAQARGEVRAWLAVSTLAAGPEGPRAVRRRVGRSRDAWHVGILIHTRCTRAHVTRATLSHA